MIPMTWDEAHDAALADEIVEESDIDPNNVWTDDEIEEEAYRLFLHEVNADLPIVDWALEELADLDEKTMFDHYGYEEA